MGSAIALTTQHIPHFYQCQLPRYSYLFPCTKTAQCSLNLAQLPSHSLPFVYALVIGHLDGKRLWKCYLLEACASMCSFKAVVTSLGSKHSFLEGVKMSTIVRLVVKMGRGLGSYREGE